MSPQHHFAHINPSASTLGAVLYHTYSSRVSKPRIWVLANIYEQLRAVCQQTANLSRHSNAALRTSSKHGQYRITYTLVERIWCNRATVVYPAHLRRQSPPQATTTELAAYLGTTASYVDNNYSRQQYSTRRIAKYCL